jgi:hypothetical protein
LILVHGIGRKAVMNLADGYRRLAAQMEARARAETSIERKGEWLALARGYRRLAEQADPNVMTDLVSPWLLRPTLDRGAGPDGR